MIGISRYNGMSLGRWGINKIVYHFKIDAVIALLLMFNTYFFVYDFLISTWLLKGIGRSVRNSSYRKNTWTAFLKSK